MGSNRIRVLLVSSLAALALAAVVASAASADEYVWKYCHAQAGGLFKNNLCTEAGPPTEFEKLTLNAGQAKNAKSKNVAGVSYLLEGAIGATPVEIECKKQGEEGVGNIKGGNPGTDEATVTFTECKVLGAATCTVAVEATKVNTEIVEIVKELNEDTGVETAVDAKVGELFTPRPPATKFTTITIGVCALKGKFDVTGNVVAHVSPEEQEVKTPKLIFRDSNPVTEVEKAPNDEKLAVGLKFANNPAELLGESEVELESKEAFGAFGPGA